MDKIIFRKDDASAFLYAWNSFLEENNSSIKYKISFLEYTLSLTQLVDDLSFVLISSNKPEAICFLPVEKTNNYKSISIRNNFINMPLATSNTFYQVVFNQIDKLVRKNGIDKIMFEIDPLISENTNLTNRLLDYNFIDVSNSNYLIDLKLSQNDFLNNLSQSYRREIKKFIEDKDCEVKSYTGSQSDKDIFNAYENAHFISAGRKTRSKKSFDNQFLMMLEGDATLLSLRYNKKNLGFLFLGHANKSAILFSIADLPQEENKLPIHKILIYYSYKYLKNNRYGVAECGQPANSDLVEGFLNYSDEKGVRISKYKMGYNPKKITHFRGIKYLSTQPFIEDLDDFKSQVTSKIESI